MEGKSLSLRYLEKTLKKPGALFTVLMILGAINVPRAAAQTTPSGIPLSELERFVSEHAAERIGVKTAGAAIAAIKDGEIILNRTYGYAVQDQVETGADSVFEWGSGTKMLVWTSVMQLVEQKKLSLDTDIREYLPANFLKKLKYETPVTMYHLMHHNAGWEDRIIDLFYSSASAVPDLEGSLRAYEPAQIYPPGTVTAYSNFGVAIAGFIIERLTGQPFYEYVWDNIFNPLGMKDTSIHPLQADNPSVAGRRARIKGHNSGKKKPVPSPIERIYIGLYPAGSATGTVEDAAKFLSALMPAEGETCVLFRNNETLNEMLSTSYLFKEGFPGVAHGFFESYYAVKTLGHGGNTAAFSSLFTLCPEERFAFAVMTNQANETALCYNLTKAVFGEYEPPAVTGALPDARTLSGVYYTARKSETGFSNFVTSLSMFPVKAVDENTLNLGGAKLVQISPYVFKNTGGLEFLDMINLLAFEVKDGKAVRASVVLFDLLPASPGRMIAVWGSAIILILCVMYVIAALIIIIVSAVKDKKRKIAPNITRKLNIALYASVAAVVINNLIAAARLMSFAVYASITIHFVINIAYMIFAPVCAGFTLANRKKEPLKGRKIFSAFTMASSLSLAIVLLAWGFWR